MKTPFDIILRPIVTEHSMMGVPNKVYTFEVALGAGKIEVKNAVEEIFKVKVAKVNTMNVKGKPRRVRFQEGTTRRRKKAIVKLTDDSKPIEFFEGMY